MSGNGKIRPKETLIGGPVRLLRDEFEKGVFDIASKFDPEVLADAGLSLFLTILIGSQGPENLKRLGPVKVLNQQLDGFKELLESVKKERAKKRIITA